MDKLIKDRIKLNGDRILIRPTESENKTASGIIIPDMAKEKPKQGVILAIAPGINARREEEGNDPIQPGEYIYYGKFSGVEFNPFEEQLVVMNHMDIMCSIPEKFSDEDL